MPGSPAICLAAAAACLAAAAATALAQSDINNAAYVQTDIDAQREIENARMLEARGRAADAVSAWLGVRNRFPDALFRSEWCQDGLFELFIPVRTFVDERLVRMGGAGRAAYLNRADLAASTRLAEIMREPEEHSLREFLREYDPSTSGPPARLMLGDMLAERGEIDAAIRVWQPLLDRGPAGEEVVSRLAYSYAGARRHQGLAELVRKKLPGAQKYAALLGGLQSAGGGLIGPPMDPGTVTVETRWTLPLKQLKHPDSHPDLGRVSIPSMSDKQDRGLSPVLACVFGDEAYFNLSSGPAVIDLATGRWVSEALVPRQAGPTGGGVFARKPLGIWNAEDDSERSRAVYETDPLFEDAVSGMSASGDFAVAQEPERGDNREGGHTWSLEGFTRKREGAKVTLTRAWKWFPGTARAVMGPNPAIGQGRVYAVVCELNETNGNVSHYLACIDSVTGETLWTTFLASFNKPRKDVPINGFFPQPAPPLLHIDTVFVATNMGVIAAVDAESGNVKWVLKYVIPSEGGSFWHWNPLVLSDGVLMAGPRDHPFLVALDPESGRPLWSHWNLFNWDRKMYEFKGEVDTRYRHLAGACDGAVLFTSETFAYAYDIGEGMHRWSYALGDTVIGRSAIARGRMFVPVTAGIVVLDIARGRRTGAAGRTHLVRWEDVFSAGDGGKAVFDPSSGVNLWAARPRARFCLTGRSKGKPACDGRVEEGPEGVFTCGKCGMPFQDGRYDGILAAGRFGVLFLSLSPK